MSLALDPDQTIDYQLVTDVPKGDKGPTFVFRFLSTRDWAKVARLFQEADAATNEQDHLRLLYEALRIPLVDWRNMGIPFDPNELDRVTTPADMVEMRSEMLNRLVFSEIDRK